MTDSPESLKINNFSLFTYKMSNKETFVPIKSESFIYTVKQFLADFESKTCADYSFQSRVRWTTENKSSYITSLITGMAPSKFILACTSACHPVCKVAADKEYYVEWKNRGIEYLNIDSNNRVTTLGEFIKGSFGIQPGVYQILGQVIEIVKGKNDTYDSLPQRIKESFHNATITVEIVTSATRDQLSQLFIRTNSGISLNGPEKRNAVISDFSDTVRDLATEYQETLSKFFEQKDINRRKIDDFIAGLALLYFGGLDTKITDKNLWSAYESGSTEDKLIYKFKSDFKSFINFMGDYLKALPNKNCVLDLFVQVKDLKDNNFNISNRDGFIEGYMKSHAVNLTKSTTYNHSDGREATYKELMRSREVKFNKLRRKIITKTWNPEEFCTQLDPKRNFSKEQKFNAAVRQNWVTPEGKTIDKGRLFDPTAYHGGHIEPHADGGSTNDENCAIQEAADNLKLGRNPIS